MIRPVKIVGVGGTARTDSSSERVVCRALDAARAMGAKVELFDGPFIASLPLYIPAYRTDGARAPFRRGDSRLRRHLRRVARLSCSLSGPVKNALDLLEDLARDGRPYLDGRAFGSIVTAMAGRRAGPHLLPCARSRTHCVPGRRRSARR